MRAGRIGAGLLLIAAGLVAASVPNAAGDALPAGGVADAGPLAAAVRLHPPGRSFTVAAVGDFLSESVVNAAAAADAPPGVRYDYEPLLRPLEFLVQSADLAICHMETPIGVPGATVGLAGTASNGLHLIAAAYEAPFDLRRVGFDRCSTASNHSNDLGTAGIDSTLTALDAAGLGHSGTARTPAEAAVSTFMVNGVRVAHLAYARNSNTGWPRDDWRIAKALTAATVIADVQAARAMGAEVVIVSLHVYVEMLSAPMAEDRALVDAITAGSDVDLIVMHGPHVVQPVERVHGTLVHWSVGNLISGMGVPGRGKYSDPRALDGLMAMVRFSEQPDGSWTAEPWTVLLCNSPTTHTVYPGLATLADPALSGTLRTQLTACAYRTAVVVPDLH